jgi:predicted  nucleic acid-binding Zn-ribbon protein
MSQLEQAIQTLGDTIGSITGKVQEEKSSFAIIKKNIITQIQSLSEKIAELRNKLQFVPRLKQQLDKCNEELRQKDAELQQANNIINKANEEISNIRSQVAEFNNMIQEKQNEINNLNNANNENQRKIQELNNIINDLNNRKQQAESELARLHGEVTTIVDSLNRLNARLTDQIKSINTIVAEFQSGDDISSLLTEMGRNIQQIINELTPDGSGISSETPHVVPEERIYPYQINTTYNNLMNLSNEALESVLKALPNASVSLTAKNDIRDNFENAKTGAIVFSENKIKDAIKSLQDKGIDINSIIGSIKRKGGYKKHNTRKRKYNKHYFKGGYIYTSSKELDKSSSVISSSTGSKTKSLGFSKGYSRRSKKRHNKKTRKTT